MRALWILTMLALTTTAGAGEAGTAKGPNWRLRCTQKNSKAYAVVITATSKSLIVQMHAAMLRQGTIDRTDFCATTVER